MGEYISNLPPTVRQHSPSKVTMRIGSLVLIRPDGYTPRLQWPLATIEGLHPGADERVRTVTLRTSKGLAKRPVQRLHLLEMAEPPRTVEMIAGEDQGDSATEEGEAQPESLPNGNEEAEELEWHPPSELREADDRYHSQGDTEKRF